MSSTKPFVLFFNPVKHAQPFYQKLQEVAHTEVATSKSRDEFFQDVTTKYKDIFAIYRTSASGAVSLPDLIDLSPLPGNDIVMLCIRKVLKRLMSGCGQV
jgi:hypothetical protein